MRRSRRQVHRVGHETVLSFPSRARHFEIDPITECLLPLGKTPLGGCDVIGTDRGADVAPGAEQRDQSIGGGQQGLAANATVRPTLATANTGKGRLGSIGWRSRIRGGH